MSVPATNTGQQTSSNALSGRHFMGVVSRSSPSAGIQVPNGPTLDYAQCKDGSSLSAGVVRPAQYFVMDTSSQYGALQ